MPTVLTDQGIALLVKSGAKEYIDNNKEDLLKLFLKEHKGVDHPYDIQQKAQDFMRAEMKGLDDVKDYAFRNSSHILDVVQVAGLYFRDIIMRHKGMDPDDEKYKKDKDKKA